MNLVSPYTDPGDERQEDCRHGPGGAAMFWPADPGTNWNREGTQGEGGSGDLLWTSISTMLVPAG
jgi:hypothetical protein